jgi:ATP-dependent protease Clp ATPase subunit
MIHTIRPALKGGKMSKEKCKYCSFCGKNQDKIAYMVVNDKNSKKQVNICDECIGLCCEIIFGDIKRIEVKKKKSTFRPTTLEKR